MYFSRDLIVDLRSPIQPSSSVSARCNSALSISVVCVDSFASTQRPSIGCQRHRKIALHSQIGSVGKIFLVAGLLTTSSLALAESTLQTQRDERLQKLRLEAISEEPSSLLSERSIRLSDLRNRYIDAMRQHAFAAEAQISSVSAITSSNTKASGIQALIDGVFQFNTNWRTDFGWHFGQKLTTHPTLIRETDSEIPTINHLTLAHGRERSVETSFGLFKDTPLLSGTSPQSLFSGASIKLHPLIQKLFPQSPQYQFELEQGWSSIRNSSNENLARVSIQRTRPRLTMEIEKSNWNFSSAIALEWYSESEPILGKILAQRSAPARRTKYSIGEFETQWRLFSVALSSRLNQGSDLNLWTRVERVSNPIGKTTRPAWSVEFGSEKQFSLAREFLIGGAAVQFVESPAGAVPAARLPLEINPGTSAFQAAASLRWIPYLPTNQSVSIEIRRIQETLTDTEGWLHCPNTPTGFETPTTKTCTTGWVHLAWSLKLPTNL